jgi:hypothetical protein
VDTIEASSQDGIMGRRRKFFVTAVLGVVVAVLASVGAFMSDRSAATVAYADTTTTLVPTTSLTLVYPTSGPAGTDVTVEGSECSSVAGSALVFFAAVDAPRTYLATADAGVEW